MFYFSAPAINTIIATVSVTATMVDGKENFRPNRSMKRLIVSCVDEEISMAGGIASSKSIFVTSQKGFDYHLQH